MAGNANCASIEKAIIEPRLAHRCFKKKQNNTEQNLTKAKTFHHDNTFHPLPVDEADIAQRCVKDELKEAVQDLDRLWTIFLTKSVYCSFVIYYIQFWSNSGFLLFFHAKITNIGYHLHVQQL